MTKPFAWENRTQVALQGIVELTHHVDSLIAIPNDKLLTVLPEDVTMEEAFSESNDVLFGAVQGIADIILRPGRINVDFADVCTVMRERGVAIMGTGQANGEGRAQEATEKAIRSPLLEDIDLHDARGVLVNITTGPSLGIREYSDVGTMVREFAAKDATVVVGAVTTRRSARTCASPSSQRGWAARASLAGCRQSTAWTRRPAQALVSIAVTTNRRSGVRVAA